MIAALLLAAAVSQPAPTYLVERVIVAGGQSRRVSVYRDGTAALVRRTRDSNPEVIWHKLDVTTLSVLRDVAGAAYDELAGVGNLSAPLGKETVEIRLAPRGRPAIDIHLPLGGVASPEARRLGIALDDIESTLATLPRGAEDLSAWIPKVGERVRLNDGSVVRIDAIHRTGDTVVVQVSSGDGAATTFFELDELRRRAVRRIRP